MVYDFEKFDRDKGCLYDQILFIFQKKRQWENILTLYKIKIHRIGKLKR